MRSTSLFHHAIGHTTHVEVIQEKGVNTSTTGNETETVQSWSHIDQPDHQDGKDERFGEYSARGGTVMIGPHIVMQPSSVCPVRILSHLSILNVYSVVFIKSNRPSRMEKWNIIATA